MSPKTDTPEAPKALPVSPAAYGSPQNTPLDWTDLYLLKRLVEQPGIGVAELAKEVKMDRGSVGDRLRKPAFQAELRERLKPAEQVLLERGPKLVRDMFMLADPETRVEQHDKNGNPIVVSDPYLAAAAGRALLPHILPRKMEFKGTIDAKLSLESFFKEVPVKGKKA